MADLENLIVAEARKHGFAVTADAVMQSAIDLAGGTMTNEGLISLPGRGTISIRDYARALQASMPAAFRPLDADQPEAKPGSLTEAMRQEVAASRRKTALPDDWNEVRARYEADTVTGRMMREREAAR